MNVGEGHKEGYLQRKFRSGVVKTLKKKWYVLKDGELRCYESKVACDNNVKMYQDCLPVHKVQTVRRSNEQHGIEIVTQQKTLILVASSGEEQQEWIKAIYEMMKDNRSRSVSCPTAPAVETGNRKRSSSGSKVSISRILPGFAKKSVGDSQWHQSKFFLDPEPEIPIQPRIDVKVEQNGTHTSEKVFADVFDTQDVIDKTYTRVEVDNVKSTDIDKRGTQPSVNYDTLTTLRPPSDLGEVTGDETVRQADEECHDTDEQESGVQELKLLLRNSKLMEGQGDDQSVGCEDENFGDDDIDGDEYDDSDKFDEDTEENDERSETTNQNVNDTSENGKSAFERLQELLQG